MNSPAVDISTILASVSSLGLTEATNLFINKMPNKPDICVAVMDSPGDAPLPTIERYERPSVQILVRGKKNTGFANAYSTAENIKLQLHTYSNQTVGGTRYIGIWAETDILPLGNDDNDRPELSMNFRIHRTA